MWDCIKCGCMAIAGSLMHCPMCKKEREVPKSTTGGGSNGYEPQVEEPEAPVTQPEAEPETAVEEEPVPEPAPAPEPAPTAPIEPEPVQDKPRLVPVSTEKNVASTAKEPDQE